MNNRDKEAIKYMRRGLILAVILLVAIVILGNLTACGTCSYMDSDYIKQASNDTIEAYSNITSNDLNSGGYGIIINNEGSK